MILHAGFFFVSAGVHVSSSTQLQLILHRAFRLATGLLHLPMSQYRPWLDLTEDTLSG